MKRVITLCILTVFCLVAGCGQSKSSSNAQVTVCDAKTFPQADSTLKVEYKNKTYEFCSPTAAKLFKQDPSHLANKIKIIKLTASRYKFVPNSIVVNRGDIVRLIATSTDVTHGIFIKDYNVDVPISKGEKKIIEFIADKTGDFTLHCSVYCGPGHMNMKSNFKVQ